MVQTVAKDLLRRGFKAIEAFGDARWKEPACVLPADIFWPWASRRCGRIPLIPG